MTMISDRIARRLETKSTRGVVHDQSALDPTVCHGEVQGRGPVVERVLDAIDPVFSGSLPPSVYIWGPKGSGKSAVLTSIVRQFRRAGGHGGGALYTATRTQRVTLPVATYVDLRGTSSEYAFYRRLLGTLVEGETVPSKGISTEALRTRVRDRLEEVPPTIVVTDHVGDSLAPETSDVGAWLAATAQEVAWIGVGRRVPEALDVVFERCVEVPAYRCHALVDVLTGRIDAGLSSGSMTHAQLETVATWADGDAHDALAAVYEAAMTAHEAGRADVSNDELDDAIEAVPDPCTSLARLFALPNDHQKLVYGLTDIRGSGDQSVSGVAEALVGRPSIDLRPSTVERILYELADHDILRRVDGDPEKTNGRGRPPSHLEMRVPSKTYVRLFEAQS